MSYQCEYCKTNFSQACSMYKHQRTAQYCLKMQGKSNKLLYCPTCNGEFSRKDALLRHKKNCTATIQHEPEQSPPLQNNSRLENQISDLLQAINLLIQKPPDTQHNTKNNVVMNLQPITDEEITSHLVNLSIDFIHDGGKGYANFAGSYPFKDRIICTDRARKKLRYNIGNGEMIDDGGGVRLTQQFFQAIAPRNEELINAEYKNLHNEVQQIATHGTAADSNLTDILTKASHLQELLLKCRDAANGVENDLTKEFIHHLSKLL